MTELLIEIASWFGTFGFIAAIIADTFRWSPGVSMPLTRSKAIIGRTVLA